MSHFFTSFIIAGVLWKTNYPRFKRFLLAAYPIRMAFSLVYLGEHFVIDIFVGWLYAAATFYFGSKLLDRWAVRQARRHPPVDQTAELVTP
jgi:membrane-associated phospholipid phosphatase